MIRPEDTWSKVNGFRERRPVSVIGHSQYYTENHPRGTVSGHDARSGDRRRSCRDRGKAGTRHPGPHSLSDEEANERQDQRKRTPAAADYPDAETENHSLDSHQSIKVKRAPEVEIGCRSTRYDDFVDGEWLCIKGGVWSGSGNIPIGERGERALVENGGEGVAFKDVPRLEPDDRRDGFELDLRVLDPGERWIR
ncbi:hypothetical protein K474DRAFT_1675212 [Panus rudis PR-1116 ss-1]|nr:hypothetical protein K474DRAFT_1675212 [Panus rudis PR-1116 ss-1]